jgi:hypothetical protein
MADLQVGDVVALKYGPFSATGEVVSILRQGAVVQVDDNAQLVGFNKLMQAPNGHVLTKSKTETFIGRAHWRQIEVLND